MIVVYFNTFNFFLICSRLFYLEPSFEYVLQLILIKRFLFFFFLFGLIYEYDVILNLSNE